MSGLVPSTSRTLIARVRSKVLRNVRRGTLADIPRGSGSADSTKYVGHLK